MSDPPIHILAGLSTFPSAFHRFPRSHHNDFATLPFCEYRSLLMQRSCLTAIAIWRLHCCVGSHQKVEKIATYFPHCWIRSYTATFMIHELCSLNDRRARADNAVDFNAENVYFN